MNAKPEADTRRRSLAFQPNDEQLLTNLRSELERRNGKAISLSFTMREALKALAEKLNVSVADFGGR